VIEANRPSHEAILHKDPTMTTPSTNLQPTKVNKKRRKHRIREIPESADKGKHGESSSSGGSKSKSSPPMFGKIMTASTSSSSTTSDRSQLVDLVVEDHEAEEIERVRAKKEGGPDRNEAPPKHFVSVNTARGSRSGTDKSDRRAYPDDHQAGDVRQGHEPQRYDPLQPRDPQNIHNTDQPFAIGDDNEAVGGEAFEEGNSEGATNWQRREHTDPDRKAVYGSFPEERHIWRE